MNVVYTFPFLLRSDC